MANLPRRRTTYVLSRSMLRCASRCISEDEHLHSRRYFDGGRKHFSWHGASQRADVHTNYMRMFTVKMLVQHLPLFTPHRIVLASASPRRQELLTLLGLKCEVIPSTFAEDLPHEGHTPVSYVRETARHKTLEVARRLAAEGSRAPVLIIGADTVVEVDGDILEKPADDDDAVRMLTRLSGRQHVVHTGVVLIMPQAPAGSDGGSGAESVFSQTTTVQFDPLSDADIRAYVATGECFGKAGSYGIQGPASQFVHGITGDFFNVMGFPVNEFSRRVGELIEAGTLAL